MARPPKPAAPALVDSCGACHWWHRIPNYTAGVCHRYPPVVLMGAAPTHPTTQADDFCGEFREASPSPPPVIPRLDRGTQAEAGDGPLGSPGSPAATGG